MKKKYLALAFFLGSISSAFAQEAVATQDTPAPSQTPASTEVADEEKSKKDFSLVGLQPEIQNMRKYGKDGLKFENRFEGEKDTVTKFDGIKVRLGAAFAVQWQGLSEDWKGKPTDGSYKGIGPGFNTPTANLNLDVQLADGVTMKVETYLSSRHHNETWVKGGYLQMDKSPIAGIGVLDKFFEYGRVKFGQYDINYGDNHYSRSDNGNAAWNPFVGNNIMDAFTTELGGEVQYQRNGWIGVFGMTSGALKGDINGSTHQNPSILGKLGYQKKVNEEFAWRLTGSVYHNSGSQSNTLYSGDRAGSRYYGLFGSEGTSGQSNGNYNPGFSGRVTALMINPSIFWKNFEVLGTIERSTGNSTSEIYNADKTQKLSDDMMADPREAYQYAIDVIYRFGDTKQYYVAGRYNAAGGQMSSGKTDANGKAINPDYVDISRFQAAAGWFMTKNILLKCEYVNQTYSDAPEGYTGSYKYYGSKFNGYMIEAVVSF